MKEKEIRLGIKTVYGELWELLSLYEETNCFNQVPEGEDEQDIWFYMGKRIQNVRRTVSTIFLGEYKLLKKLHQIVDETEYFIRRYETVGVVLRWKQINPKLLYFDCAFEIMEEAPEMYKKIRSGLSNFSLSCYPDEEMIVKRKEYFERIWKKSEQNNLKYTKKRIFQEELQHTLTLLFEKEFEEYL